MCNWFYILELYSYLHAYLYTLTTQSFSRCRSRTLYKQKDKSFQPGNTTRLFGCSLQRTAPLYNFVYFFPWIKFVRQHLRLRCVQPKPVSPITLVRFNKQENTIKIKPVFSVFSCTCPYERGTIYMCNEKEVISVRQNSGIQYNNLIVIPAATRQILKLTTSLCRVSVLLFGCFSRAVSF